MQWWEFDPLSAGSITDFFPADGGQVPSGTGSGTSSGGGSGVDWGGLFTNGLNRWLDVEVWKATDGAGVPQWNAKPKTAPGATAAAGAGLAGNLPLLIGLGVVAFLVLRKA